MLCGTHADKESLLSGDWNDSSSHVSMSVRKNERVCADSGNIPRDISTHPLRATPHARDGIGVTGSLPETGSCPSIEGAVGGANGAVCSAFFKGPPRGYPAGEPLVLGDPSSGAISV